MARIALSGWLHLLLGTLGAHIGVGLFAAEPTRPNILYIFTDDQSYRTVGCYREEGAYDWVRTPNIDRLAQRGVRFTHAYLGSWCLPSRFTALTGRHPYAIESFRHGLVYPRNSYDPERMTFWPRVFRAEGYYTGMIGKWHTGKDAGFGRDWDYQIVWNRPAGSRANASAYYTSQELNFHGGKKPVKVEGYPADHYTDWAVEFIRGRAGQEQPWALWLCYPNAHPPFTPAQRHQEAYGEVTVPVPADIFMSTPGKPEYVERLRAWAPNALGEPVMARVKTPTAGGAALKGDTLSHWARQYQQCVSAIDDGVGEIMAALAASGQEESTLVIFTSDQGFAIGQHGFSHKLAPYDANLRSPLIISQPGRVPQGEVCRRPVGGVDLVATIYAQGGVESPDPLDGHDLTPLLNDPGSQSWDHPVVQSYTRMAFGRKSAQIWRSLSPVGPPVPWWTSVVQGRYKYVRTMVRGEMEELYDLRKDPEEMVNLALRPENLPLLREMRGRLDAELRRTGAPFVDRMPATGTEEKMAGAESRLFKKQKPQVRAGSSLVAHPSKPQEPNRGLARVFGKRLLAQSGKPEAKLGKRASSGLRS